nr:hypothetical protein [Bacilli bacterium]
MAKKDCAVIKRCIKGQIKDNQEHNKDYQYTIGLNYIKNIIYGKNKYVLDFRKPVNEYSWNQGDNVFPANKILIAFSPYETFFLGFDTEISDHRKRFLPIGKSVIEYEALEKYYGKLVWVRLSDICSTERVFSYGALESLNSLIVGLLEQYPDFYNMLFDEKREMAKKISLD